MMRALLGFAVGVSLLLLLFGCGGSGGGGTGGGPMTLVNWSSVVPPENVEADGISQDADYTVGADPVYVERGASTNSSAILTLDSEGVIERIDISTPYVELFWDADSDLVNATTKWVFAIDGDQSNIAIGSNPIHPDSNPWYDGVGWEYQTFGAWMTGRQLDGFTGNGMLGGITVGAKTPVDAVPDSDTATFSGNSAGLFIDALGQDYFVYSEISVVADFDVDTLTFSTVGDALKTPVSELLDGEPSLADPDSDLNLSGVLNYNADTNLFVGTLATDATLDLSGSSTGQFYGPNAEELGGGFSLKTIDTESSLHYSGAYGAAAIPNP